VPDLSNSMSRNQPPLAPSSADAFDSPPALLTGIFDAAPDSTSTDATRWKLVEELFHAAAAVPVSHRGAYLSLACAGDSELQSDVESLLAFDQGEESGGEALPPLAALINRTTHEMTEETEKIVGTRIGPYVVLREIGHGGMGTVYLAERADGQFQQKVALKVVSGFCTKTGRERFLAERQLLANLDHPNVARLLDGGETEQGQPYFAMEYLEGESIAEYFARRRTNTAERVEIFEQVCAAVHYAHQKLAIHRDLKPDNILITSVASGGGERASLPVAKVLDFGIAKLIDAASPQESSACLTLGPQAMTPPYASPEQFRGRPVSTSTDVYSLGAVLYEILSGHRPYNLQGKTPAEMERAICEEDPLSPSRAALKEGGQRSEPAVALWRELRGDLDKITAMAMAKEPEQRYGSAQALAEDLRRYRMGFPVLAHGGGFFYRLKKQWKRNRLVFSATAILLLSWFVGTAMVLRESRRTRQREEQVRNLAAALLLDTREQTSSPGLNTGERAAVVKQALENLSQLARDHRNDPALDLQRAIAYQRVGDLQGHPMESSLGDSVGAENSYRASLEILDRLAAANPRDLAVMYRQIVGRRLLGELLRDARGLDAGIECMRKGAEVADRALPAAPNDDTLRSDAALLFRSLSRALTQSGSFAEASTLLDRAFAIYNDLQAHDPKNLENLSRLAECYGGRMYLFQSTGKLQDSFQDGLENLRLRQSLMQQDPRNGDSRRNLMIAYERLGDVLGDPLLPNLGDHHGGAAYLRQARALAETIAADDPTDINAFFDLAMTRKRLALTLIAADERAEAQPELEAGLQQAERLLKIDPTHRRNLLLAQTFHERFAEAAGLAGDTEQANRGFDTAQAMVGKILERSPTDGEGGIASMEIEILRLEMDARGMNLAAFAHTEAHLAALAERFETVLPKTPSRAFLAYADLGRLNEKIGNIDQARRWYEKSLEGWHRLQAENNLPATRAQEPERMARLLQALPVHRTAISIPGRP
jgi:serine/threonine protein kinase